jgi:methylated-DNA-[protein]-cysteine S-methyltransferase
MKIFYTEFPTPLGTLHLRGTETALRAVYMEGHRERPPLPSDALRDGAPLRSARQQIEEFLAGQRRGFCMSFEMSGTRFQMRVWKELLAIPYGETRSYGEIARSIGSAHACRAVGSANRSNPLSIVVPCHRVIGATGAISGYGGGIVQKHFLLALEDRTFADSLPQSRRSGTCMPPPATPPDSSFPLPRTAHTVGG